jgi:hypothetical protein
MANEVIFVGDVHANEFKILNWQTQCIKKREHFPVIVLDYPTIITCGDTVQHMNVKDFDKAVEKMNEIAKLYGVKVDTRADR